MRLALGCAVGLWVAASVARAGTQEDCAKSQNRDLAIQACSQLIRQNPGDAIAHRNRGVVYANKGDYDRAITDFNEAIRLNPRYAFAYSDRGAPYAKKGDHDRAITDFNEIRVMPSPTGCEASRMARRATTTVPLQITTKPSGSIQEMPLPTGTGVSSTRIRATTTAPLQITTRPSG
jgi:regulator of sirC expression with transglutaminase-like and TPR domain